MPKAKDLQDVLRRLEKYRVVFIIRDEAFMDSLYNLDLIFFEAKRGANPTNFLKLSRTKKYDIVTIDMEQYPYIGAKPKSYYTEFVLRKSVFNEYDSGSCQELKIVTKEAMKHTLKSYEKEINLDRRIINNKLKIVKEIKKVLKDNATNK